MSEQLPLTGNDTIDALRGLRLTAQDIIEEEARIARIKQGVQAGLFGAQPAINRRGESLHSVNSYELQTNCFKVPVLALRNCISVD